MQEEHRKAIQRNFGSLVNTTDLDTLVSALYEKGIFTAPMMEVYTDRSLTAIQRKRKLYNDIMRRGPRSFDLLLEALEENGYWDLVRLLDPNSILNSGNNARPMSNNEENTFVSLSSTRRQSQNEASNSNSRAVSATAANAAAANPPAANEGMVTNATANSGNNNNVEAPFTVIKSTKFIEDDGRNDVGLYRTRGRRRGVLLLFSYISFDNDIAKFRRGVEVDCDNLHYLFAEIGIKVISYQNLSKEETISTLEEVGVPTAGMESVFVVVSSHGYERRGSSDTDIRCSDGKLVSLREIIGYFNNQRLPQLADVPKVFIFQICRGDNTDYVWKSAHAPPQLAMPPGAETDGTPLRPGADDDAAADADARADHDHHRKMALYTNILVVQSTLPGFVSRRDPQLGSWYVQALCERFAARAHDCHVDKLFTMVDERLQEKFRIQTSSVDRWGFNRRLYLHPGLFEDAAPPPALRPTRAATQAGDTRITRFR